MPITFNLTIFVKTLHASFFLSFFSRLPATAATISVECDSSGLEPAEQKGVLEVRRLSGWKLLQVCPRPGPHVLHPFLWDILHDGLLKEVQVQPLFSHQGEQIHFFNEKCSKNSL